MEKAKEIILNVIGVVITLTLLWFFFTIILPILLVLGLIAIIYFTIKKSDIFKDIKKKFKKRKKKKDKIKEAVIIEED